MASAPQASGGEGVINREGGGLPQHSRGNGSFNPDGSYTFTIDNMSESLAELEMEKAVNG
jgi:hypothetical protein